MSEHINQELIDSLRSADSNLRKSAAATLRRKIDDAESSGKHGDKNPVYTELTLLVRKLLNSKSPQDHHACTAVLLMLVGISTLDHLQKMRLMVQLGTLLKGTNMAVCEEAAEVYKLAIQCRWTEAIPMVEKDISMCIEWLESGRNEVRSKTAFVLLETLCSEGISIVNNYILRILTLISPYLHNSKIEMRLAAARTLYACLKLFPKQDELSRSMLLSYIAEELIKDQSLGTIEGHHASLLRCQGLIQYGDRFMQSYFGKASELALKLRNHSSPIVSRAAISLLPILASYSPKNFAQYVIQRRNTSSDNDETLLACVSKYLVDLARNNSHERAVAFVALADIAKSCGNDFYPYLEMTTNAIRDILSQNSRPRNAKPDSEENIAAVLQTIATLASAMGAVLIDYMHDILDLMFTTGLSQSLFSSLAELGNNITELQMAIQDRILDFVSIILVDVPFRSVQHSLNSLESHMGAMSLHYAPVTNTDNTLPPNTTVSGSFSMITVSDSGDNLQPLTDSISSPIISGHDSPSGSFKSTATTSKSVSLVVSAARKVPITNESLIFALRILGYFNFSGHNLSEFVVNSLLHYTIHSSADVRKAAIYTITHILESDSLYKMSAGAGYDVASIVVEQFVSSAVTDIDTDVRLAAVQMLEVGNCFYTHLSKAQNVQALFLLTSDELLEIKLIILSIIGHVLAINPAHVMPSLRRMVIQLLTELEYACSNQERDECAQMIMMLVKSANHWIHPYVGDIFLTIMPCIDNGIPQLASKLLDTIATLAQIGGNILIPYTDTLLASIMQALGDSSSSQKRLSALRALGSCASFCGMVIDPYTDYPQLLGILTRLLKSESDEIKEETMRVIGSLGAIDSRRYKNAIAHASTTTGSTNISSSGNSTSATGGSTAAAAAVAAAGAGGIAHAGVAGNMAAIIGMGDAAIAGTGSGKPRSPLIKKPIRNYGRRNSKKYTAPPPNVMTVFNNERPHGNLVGDIQVDSYGISFSDDPIYFTSVSVNALLRILSSSEESKSHLLAVQALNTMFAPLQSVCGQYLDSVVPAIFKAMESAPPEARESYIERLGRLVGIARQLIRPYLEPLFDLFVADPLVSQQKQKVLIGLIEVLAESLNGDFGPHIQKVISFLISAIDGKGSKSDQLVLDALQALRILAPSLEGYLLLIMPRLISLLDVSAVPENVVIRALQTIGSIVSAVNSNNFMSRLILVLVRLLQSTKSLNLQTSVVDLVCVLMEQLQDDFSMFIPTINMALKRAGIERHTKYEQYSKYLFSGRPIPTDTQQSQLIVQGESTTSNMRQQQQQQQQQHPYGSSDGAQLTVDISHLRNAWTTQHTLSDDNWIEWLAKFTIELLNQSPSPALRACASLALSNPGLRTELFNPAFVSCWTCLPIEYQQEMFLSLQDVASKPNVPLEILQTILSLAGFMERDEKQIPIDLKHLAEYASRCHSLAKELHYKEAEWTLENNYDVIEKLIDLNQNMDLHDSAIGMLNYVKKEQPDIKESVEWYTRLRHWDDALTIYRQEEAEFGYSYENINGQIQCLYEMSDWETLVPIYQRIWQNGDYQLRIASANVGVNIAWAMGEFDRMQAYLSMLPDDNHNKPFYQAILAVNNNQFDAAVSYIYKARMGIREELISHISESYDRAYSQVFQCQMLTELEEVMAYKLAEGDKMMQMSIVNSWQQRLDGIQQDVDMWQKILRMRKMVLRPIRDLDMWIKYINMCRKTGRINTATRAIRNLLEDEADYMDGIIRYKITDISYNDMLQAEEYTRLQQLQQQNRYAARSELLKDGVSLNYSSTSGNSSPVYDIFDSETMDNMIRLTQKPPLVYMYIKFKWARGERQGAFQMLEMFTKKYSEKIGFDIQNPNAFADHVYACELESNSNNADYDYSDAARTHRLLSRFYSRQAEWLVDIEQSGMLEEEARNKATLGGAGIGANSDMPTYKADYQQMQGSLNGFRPSSNDTSHATTTSSQKASNTAKDMGILYRLKGENISERILESNRAATVLDHMSYKAWHNLAVRHYTESQRYDVEHISISKDIVERHAVPAVHGFIRAIQLSMGHTSLQDMLRLLTVWFNYAQFDQVVQAVQSEIKSISLRMWMQVIPQILARTHIQHQKTIDLIKHILTDIGKFHPNAIMFSLYVAARSEHPDRIKISKEILASLHELTPELVEETEVVSRELIRVTLLFPEMWHDALDYTSKLYYNFDNADEMLRILPPLYDRLRNPETLREIHFAQLFGNMLMTAEQYLRKYFSVDKEHRDESYIHQAWKYFSKVFYECGKMIQDFQHIMLDNTAPLLLECRNMHLAVPGTYDPDREVVHIDSFDPVVRVYDSKQHPRSMNICGSDGNKYTFVLKGHEDLRQDERVMQLFGLINSFLAIDDKTSQRSLAIERYPVIPLSSNVGLIGFYPNCDSITDVIRYFRESHQRSVHEENQMLHDISTDWKSLSSIERIESFEYVIERTACDDLQQAMWYNSPNAETWLERRTNYTRSLAVMSIVGYILGLGDRHLTNILLHSTNGKVVHIDLGDCFELAAQRDEYPETVPFRLTRMVTMPMEVSNIEGAFKYTAHHTMRVLRSHRDSVMAVLEAFVFDPLVSWLYTQEKENTVPATSVAPSKHSMSNVIESQIFGLGAESKPNAEDDGGRVVPGSRPDNQYSRSYRVRSSSINEKGWQMGNPKAQLIFKRIHDKLVGTDFDPNVQLSVADQVKKLVQQATSSDNLAVMYAGWMPIW